MQTDPRFSVWFKRCFASRYLNNTLIQEVRGVTLSEMNHKLEFSLGYFLPTQENILNTKAPVYLLPSI